MSKPDGRHAFPNITPDMNVDGGPGMSLRDYFAAKALEGQIAALADKFVRHLVEMNAKGTGRGLKEQVAQASYDYADAMLKARKAK